MAFKPRRLGDFRPSKRAHPVYNEIIQRKGWKPFIVCDGVACYWDCSTIRDGQNSTSVGISEPAKEQMINLILAGHFGDEVKSVLFHPGRWQRIYDDLVDVPVPGVIAEQSLHVFEFSKSPENAAPETSIRGDDIDAHTVLRPTTGPMPSSWSGVVARDAFQPSCTYVFQFGGRDLWKIGHATDVQGRLAEVSKHIPHEVLGEQWHLVLHYAWNTEVAAYEMEQKVLRALRTQSSVGERVACSREALDRAWAQSLAERVSAANRDLPAKRR